MRLVKQHAADNVAMAHGRSHVSYGRHLVQQHVADSVAMEHGSCAGMHMEFRAPCVGARLRAVKAFMGRLHCSKRLGRIVGCACGCDLL